MKSWLVFLGGGVCGAVVALGVARIFFPAGMAVMPGVTVVNATAGSDERGKNETAITEKKEDGAGIVEERIAALQSWTEGSGAEPDNDALFQTLQEWSERDPQAVLAWVQGARRLPQRLRLLALPLAEMAKKNPAGAAAWMRQYVGAQDRAVVMEAAFQRLATGEPRAALELAISFPEKEQPDDLGDALGALITESPQEALSYFNRLTGERRDNSARWMLASWAKSDASAALAWAEGQPGIFAVESVRWAFLNECAQTRPDVCVEVLRRFPASGNAYEDAHAVSGLLASSPERGVEALSLVPAETASSALTMWVRDSFEKSPERAMELLKKWVPEKEQRGAIHDGFVAWLDSDQRAAMEWLGTVTQPELRVSLQTGVIGWQAQRDPEAALAVLNGPHVASPELQDVVTQALSGWMQRDVVAAAGWAVANPGLVSVEQVEALASQFLQQDDAAGADWLAKLPAGEVRDAAVATAALHWAGNAEPELAAQTAGTIRDPEKRARALFGVYNTLLSSDKAGAERWLLEAPGISQETKQSWRVLAGGR